MTESTDLTKNPELLLQYTADEAEKELSAIEGHGAKITDDETGDEVIIGWCLECVRKHLGYIEELCSECNKAQCKPEPAWEKMGKWARINRDKFTNVIKNGKSISQSEAKDIITEARTFRKEMEKIAIAQTDSTIRHLT